VPARGLNRNRRKAFNIGAASVFYREEMAFPRLVRTEDPPRAALIARSDDELMALAGAGLRSAFEVLVERHAERLVSLCSRFVNDAQRGRELAQDSWVLVWQGRERYRGEGGFLPWLITIARNHCRNELRRRRVVSAHEREPLPDQLGQSTGQLDTLLVEERRRRVRAALEQLSWPLREALLLRYAEDLRYDEMTGVVGTGESTLRSRVHHGLKALKQKLENEP
jgi:RNA polymerase sigma-70 factor, ECF subfamily